MLSDLVTGTYCVERTRRSDRNARKRVGEKRERRRNREKEKEIGKKEKHTGRK